ncbi:MAG TPA: hypothetical protein VLM11_09495 [Streptosporangiaceae bacterium]|nr:hypothetical protein [Streptosporangiaceae bacterium]
MVLAAVGVALVATALVHLLMLGTPRPLAFFGWIIGLATVLAVLVPFSTTAPLTAKVATGVVELVIGIAIGMLISGVAARSVRLPAPGGYATPGGYPAGDALYDERRGANDFS